MGSAALQQCHGHSRAAEAGVRLRTVDAAERGRRPFLTVTITMAASGTCGTHTHVRGTETALACRVVPQGKGVTAH